jgi:hypothetical protein
LEEAATVRDFAGDVFFVIAPALFFDLVDFIARAALPPLETDFFVGVAFRTGAFSDAERLMSGLGRAAEAVGFRPVCLRAFAEPEETLCGAGRAELLFTPLMTGSLIRNTQIFINESEIDSLKPRAA